MTTELTLRVEISGAHVCVRQAAHWLHQQLTWEWHQARIGGDNDSAGVDKVDGIIAFPAVDIVEILAVVDALFFTSPQRRLRFLLTGPKNAGVVVFGAWLRSCALALVGPGRVTASDDVEQTALRASPSLPANTSVEIVLNGHN